MELSESAVERTSHGFSSRLDSLLPQDQSSAELVSMSREIMKLSGLLKAQKEKASVLETECVRCRLLACVCHFAGTRDATDHVVGTWRLLFFVASGSHCLRSTSSARSWRRLTLPPRAIDSGAAVSTARWRPRSRCVLRADSSVHSAVVTSPCRFRLAGVGEGGSDVCIGGGRGLQRHWWWQRLKPLDC
jgi:hypothetical protein